MRDKETEKIKHKQIVKFRARFLKQKGFHALHDFGAWASYRESVKAAKAERHKASFRLLGGPCLRQEQEGGAHKLRAAAGGGGDPRAGT